MLVWHVSVDADVLRGSGRSLPPEVGTFLGLSPGENGLVLRNTHTDVSVTWTERSITGPNIGSIRLHAEALQAKESDILRLTFVKGNELGVALVPPLAENEAPPETLSRLTGLPVAKCHDLSALASSIGVSEGKAVDALVKRRDTQVAMAAELVRLSCRTS